MIPEHHHFTFGVFKTSAHITLKLPTIEAIANDCTAGNSGEGFFKPLLICDHNTRYLAEQIRSNAAIPICELEAGEAHKNWTAVETILRGAKDAGLGRDGTFIGIGGGVAGDLSAFAASIYMRGCSLALVSTTLLSMVDAGLGGKTGFDLFGVKNFAGTFYPARHVYMPMDALATLPAAEWKSGMAELIKTAILAGDDFLNELSALSPEADTEALGRCVSRAAQFKGGIVEEDPLEKGSRRILLNLGHTFGHALESTAGLGTISHGEAVAWGIARACELGLYLDICPRPRAEHIRTLLATHGYETAAPHPLMRNSDSFMRALGSDKKKRNGNISFIVPDNKSARPVHAASFAFMDTITNIINGKLSL